MPPAVVLVSEEAKRKFDLHGGKVKVADVLRRFAAASVEFEDQDGIIVELIPDAEGFSRDSFEDGATVKILVHPDAPTSRKRHLSPPYPDSGKKPALADDDDGKRSFYSGSALVLSKHYYVPWHDLAELVADMKAGRWLLLTAPWQSGKSSLLKGLSKELKEAGYLVVTTTVSPLMVKVANNLNKPELEAADEFFDLLADTICWNSGNKLKKPTKRVRCVADMFRDAGRQVIWLVDECQMLNSIFHTTGYAVQQLLTDLRECKQRCRPRDPDGPFWLCSFSLCGLPRLSSLICGLRDERAKQQPYAHSSRPHDPLRPMSPSPLSKEVDKKTWALTQQDIRKMLEEYADEYRVLFTAVEDNILRDKTEEHEKALTEICKEIYELTLGHKGLVGCCCEVLQRRCVTSVERWKQFVRTGTLKDWAFNSRVYDSMVINSGFYSDELKQIMMECLRSPDGSAEVIDRDKVLEAIDDGVLVDTEDRSGVRISSPLLISSLLESCSFAAIEHMPEPTASLLVGLEAAITLMSPGIFLREKVLNATGQPSEYVMQSQFFVGLKFVLDKKIFTGATYRVLVETRQKKKKGQDRLRMCFSMENGGAPDQGIEIECGGNAKSIKRHVEKLEVYRILHKCSMHYIYFGVSYAGEDDGTIGIIQEQAAKFPQVLCWYVEFSKVDEMWNLRRFNTESMSWYSVKKAPAPDFPAFLRFQLRKKVI